MVTFSPQNMIEGLVYTDSGVCALTSIFPRRASCRTFSRPGASWICLPLSSMGVLSCLRTSNQDPSSD